MIILCRRCKKWYISRIKPKKCPYCGCLWEGTDDGHQIPFDVAWEKISVSLQKNLSTLDCQVSFSEIRKISEEPIILDKQREFLLLELVAKNNLRQSMLNQLVQRRTMTYAELKEMFPYPRHRPLYALIRYGYVLMSADSRLATDEEKTLSIPERELATVKQILAVKKIIYRYKTKQLSMFK